LALAYHQIAQRYAGAIAPPSIDVGPRRTTLKFKIGSDAELFATAFVAIVPFKDAQMTQENLLQLVQTIGAPKVDRLLQESEIKVREIRNSPTFARIVQKGKFFHAPTQTILTNSSDRPLNIHHHPHFGKRSIDFSYANNGFGPDSVGSMPNLTLPPVSLMVNFIKGLHLSSSSVAGPQFPGRST
jgi:hypothetical protein